ncbi:unnamed protein product [Bemisia tabaci]|uniref:Choline O-acetyltransferase n=1 Tax=Bemisia tabaci TaxID=7038 RepID=A0A9P0EYX0_BEMTA|nr:unnamed protein product [Bemisia tabaci]
MSLPKRLIPTRLLSQDDKPEEVELPKLPVPTLQHTMVRYREALKPILTAAQFETSCTLIKAFEAENGPGSRIQKALLDRREQFDNWAYDWWLHDMYLNNQICLPVNSNPGMVFPPEYFSQLSDMANYAATFVGQMLKHKAILDRRALPIERATSREKGQPLCMAQYYRLLTSYRRPGLQCDRLISTENSPLYKDDPHVIVICKNQMYRVRLKKLTDGEFLNENELADEFHGILQECENLEPQLPVGILTSQRRNIWAESREILLSKGADNEENLNLIEECVMIVCFDMEVLGDQFNSRSNISRSKYKAGNRDETNMMHQMLHGGGFETNSGNRWFDKTIQVVVGMDGVCGLCYEHSPSEAVSLLQVVEDILEKSRSVEVNCSPVPKQHSAQREKLNWVVDSEIEKHVIEASRIFQGVVEDLDFCVMRFDGYGKNFIKQNSVSPDVYVQLALQMTYHRLHGRLVATYESASTRRFALGRVDCIRSATSEALEWASAMNLGEAIDEVEPNISDPLQPTKRVSFKLCDDKQKLEYFDRAVKKQTEVMIENILGDGIDVHLLGLREQAKLMKEPTDLFLDDGYKIANHFALSTSQIATRTDTFMGYGPVVPDGYGASYNPRSDSIVFCLSAFRSSQITDSSHFANALQESLLLMQQLLNTRQS